MILISYTTSDYYLNLEDMLHEYCGKYGIEHKRYDSDWYHSTSHYASHKDVADCGRMAGFAIWKPYLILDALETHDCVVYCDASVVFDGDPRPYVESVKAMSAGNTGHVWRNTAYVKRDAFVYMGCDSAEYWYGWQAWAGLMVVKKNARWVMEEMLEWCEDRRIISDDDNVCGLPNFPDFQQNRSEQAILSLLAVKYPDVISLDITPFHDCSDYRKWVPWKDRGLR